METPPDRTPIAGIICDTNPMGTDGFEFIEFTGPDIPQIEATFASLGFAAVARHRSKAVTLWRQGDINFVVNAEPDSFANAFQRVHGRSVCAIAFRVADAAKAHARAVALGAKPVAGRVGPMELNIPAISGIGGSLLYFVDRYGDRGSIYDVDFHWTGAREPVPAGDGLTVVDHLTHSVHRGRMDAWSHFYEKLFNFRQISYFDVEGRQSGVHVRAMTSPCGLIRIPITESADDTSQIEEYLHAYNGGGVQHIALGASDIFAAVETMRRQGVPFMETPAAYYELLPARMPDLGAEEIARLARNGILTDGAPTPDGGRLLQIFTATLLFPIFFEIIQRKGDQGFGEGNVKALFESAELEQMRRGTLPPKA